MPPARLSLSANRSSEHRNSFKSLSVFQPSKFHSSPRPIRTGTKGDQMRKSNLALCLLLLVPACLNRAVAQDNSKTSDTVKAPDSPAHFYQLEFVVQELNSDGKAVN